jgi:hypothetical protein
LDGNGGGLIAAPGDEATGIFSYQHQWTDNPVLFSGSIDRTGIGTGYQNTLDIIAVAEPSNSWTAAWIAARPGYYNDWFLPSKDELNEMYLNKDAIGGFANNGYWSSTEGGSEDAWNQNFSNGIQGNDGKDYNSNVRAVRAF